MNLEIADHGTGTAAAEDAAASPIGIGPVEPVDVAGMAVAQLEEDVTSGFRGLSGVIGDRYSVRLYGSLPATDLVAVAEGLRIVDGRPELELAPPDWRLSPLGDGGDPYILDFVGPDASLSVTVTPGRTRAALYLNGSDLESALSGENGLGYYAVQRVEDQDLEFPSVRWWVPEADLRATTGPDVAVITEILDAFVEVDRDRFTAFIGHAAVRTIQVDTPATPPDGPTATTAPLDPDVQSRLVTFIENHVGREFESVPEVTIMDADALRSTVPAGTFVTEELWGLLLPLGLVDASDDRLQADAARRDQVRGMCCPVSVADTGDPLLNEVVLVHELTHGLDTEVDRGGSSVAEPVDPAVALVEGNAHRVAFEYAAVLNRRGAEIADPPNVFPPGGDPRLPQAVQQILEFPYDEGRLFSLAVVNAGGEEAMVAAFGRPPTTSEQVLDIDAYLSNEGPLEVSRPPTPEGAAARRQGTLGAFLILLLVEDGTGDGTAVDIATAWGGDSYVLYEHRGQDCIAARILFDGSSDAQAFVDALRLDGADIVLDGAEITLSNCA